MKLLNAPSIVGRMNDNIINDFQTKTYWQKCSSCKKEIPFAAKYYTCSVSTCQGEKLGLHFCCVLCWDAHLGFAKHRDAGALDAVSPKKAQYLASLTSEKQTRKIIIPASNHTGATRSYSTHSGRIDVDTLVVVSKVKQLINQQSDMNTSQCAIDALTQKVVQECLKAIEKAKASGRKTVMGRDIE